MQGVIVEWKGRWEDVGVISACGVVHVVRVRPLRACRVVRLWGSDLEVA